MLIAHTTGIKAHYLQDDLIGMSRAQSMDDVISTIAKLPMESQPGKVFHYSNTGLQIAGAIIKKLSGKSFNALFLERIARPLEMKDTDFGFGKVALHR